MRSAERKPGNEASERAAASDVPAEPDNVELEFANRVIFSLLKPAIALADRFRVPMKELTQLFQRAYYQVKKDRGLTLTEIGKELELSRRSVDRLAKSTRENFFTPERDFELPRKVEFLLWSGAKSEARLNQLLPHVSSAELREALDSLVDAGRVVGEEGRNPLYREAPGANRLPDDSLAAKVDALNHLSETLQNTVARRFFDGDTRAGARTVGLRVRREDLPEITKLYEEVVWKRLVELDERAKDDDEIEEIGLVMFWTPTQTGEE